MNIAQSCASPLPANRTYHAQAARRPFGGQPIIIVGRAGRHLAIRSKDHRP